MRRLVRITIATTAALAGLHLVAPVSPAAGDGQCADLYVAVTDPETGATVCTPTV